MMYKGYVIGKFLLIPVGRGGYVHTAPPTPRGVRAGRAEGKKICYEEKTQVYLSACWLTILTSK